MCFEPKPLVISKRFHFHQCKAPEERIADYAQRSFMSPLIANLELTYKRPYVTGYLELTYKRPYVTG